MSEPDASRIAPEAVLELVRRFELHREAYRTGAYNETQIRREFIDPLFKALGWDVDNTAGYAEAYKDVVHEAAVKVGGATKAPDYSFRIGGQRKFFVEAKKPSIDIRDDPSPAFQLRRYAWSAKLPLSILTDFEEVAVYDCRVRPVRTDKASKARILYLRYDELPDRWHELADVFAREAILKGSFDKFAASATRKKGTAEVDDAFLAEIESWRDSLARHVALRNPGLSQRDLNFAVQRTIDRIIFLRICEDRGIERYGTLQALLNGPEVYARLFERFRRADERYNSGLFHFLKEKDRPEAPDDLTPGLVIDDKSLKEILTRLYYPESPYEFAVLPADILGQVYEQFLGKVIRLTAGHRAVVEEKPEVRKAGGVYYTPTYIVDYIVQHTVGKLLWGYPAEADGTCLACGAGLGGRGSGGVGAGDVSPRACGGRGSRQERVGDGSDTDVQGSGSVAGGHGTGRDGLPAEPDVSSRGKVRVDQSDSAGGGFHTCQHCGRPCPTVPQGVSPSPVDRPRVTGGGGDHADHGAKARLSRRKQPDSALATRPGGGASDQRPAPRTGPVPPTPDPRPPIPQPLTPKQATRLRILDPACGSGSFLLGAYQYLLDWYRDCYVSDGPEKHAAGRVPRLFQHGSGDWRLTSAERKRILLAHIYGVDIDSQAVETTKLSLLLKVLEGENAETLGANLRLFHERALPDLAANIKCGNSLIGPDFYNGQQLTMFDEEERLRINVFDWHAEFKDIMKAGGFDAVIGNPPYLFITEVEEAHRRYFERRYSTVTYRFDLYGAFIEKATRELLHSGAVFGFIIPHTLLSNNSFAGLRALLASRTHLYRVVDIGPGVFAGARNETMLLFFRNRPAGKADVVSVVNTTARSWPETTSCFQAVQHEWAAPSGDVWLVRVNGAEARFLARLKGIETRIEHFCTVNQGLRTGNNAKYLSMKRRGAKWKRAAGGKQIVRYGVIPDAPYVFYEPSVLDAPRRPEIFFAPSKIIIQEIRNITLPRRLVATLDNDGVIGLQSTNVINAKPRCSVDLRYILGVLNSATANLFFKLMYPGNNHIPSHQLLQIPVPSPAASARHDRMVSLVQTMLDLHKQLATAKTAHAKTATQRQIDATDGQIDRLVYELYGLTDDEIRIVEEATGG